MKYKKYPKYKESGIEWLGEIPEHWNVKPIKFDYNIINGATPKSTVKEYWNGNILWITPTDLSNRSSPYINKTNRTISFLGLNSCGTTLVPVGSVILSTRAPIGNLAIANSSLCTNQGCKSAVPLHSKDARFLYYILLTSTSQLNNLGKGTTFMELSGDDLGAFKLSIPPLQEQQAIANYLDKATAKIDTLIQKQEKLIELLKEKRQALISHAVTKGLNPDAKMKESGIEWLGEIPEHWEVKKLKHIGEAIIGLTYSPSNIVDENEGTLVLRSSNLQNGGLYYGDNVYVNSNIPNKLITKAGDIVICSRNGSRKLIGKNAMIDKDSTGVSFGAFTSVFRSQQNPFIFYILNSSLFKFQSGRFMTTTINQLTTGTLNEFKIALPADDEQLQIVDYLREKTSKIDELISKATKAIELLKEKRTALISAAVTGKIDVRENI